jgi:rod shape determining protein RodA
MNILLTPITGIPLPFISYGGTFVVVILSLMGIVQSVWIHRDPDPEPATAQAKAPDPLHRLFQKEDAH